jgi:hypothetical protein
MDGVSISARLVSPNDPSTSAGANATTSGPGGASSGRSHSPGGLRGPWTPQYTRSTSTASTTGGENAHTWSSRRAEPAPADPLRERLFYHLRAPPAPASHRPTPFNRPAVLTTFTFRDSSSGSSSSPASESSVSSEQTAASANRPGSGGRASSDGRPTSSYVFRPVRYSFRVPPPLNNADRGAGPTSARTGETASTAEREAGRFAEADWQAGRIAAASAWSEYRARGPIRYYTTTSVSSGQSSAGGTTATRHGTRLYERPSSTSRERIISSNAFNFNEPSVPSSLLHLSEDVRARSASAPRSQSSASQDTTQAATTPAGSAAATVIIET